MLGSCKVSVQLIRKVTTPLTTTIGWGLDG